MKRIWCTIAGFENKRGPMLRKAEASRSWKWSPNSQQGNRTPVRQPQGSEFCQQLEWAWKQILLQSIQVRTQQSGLHLAFSLSREPSWVRSDFWLTEMWDNKWVLFLATTLVAIWYTVIENIKKIKNKMRWVLCRMEENSIPAYIMETHHRRAKAVLCQVI